MSKKIFTIDRFEKNIAVLLLRDNESFQIDLCLSELPENIEVGTIVELEIDNEGKVLSSNVLSNQTSKARQNAQELLNKIIGKK